MKRQLLLLFLVSVSVFMRAEYDYFSFKSTNGQVTTIASDNLEMNISAGQLIAKNGVDADLTLPLTDLSSMYFSTESGEQTQVIEETTADTAQVTIEWSGNTASVSISAKAKNYVTVSANGGNITLVQASTVSEQTCGEIIYNLSGSSDNGSFSLEGSYKATVNLRGLTLTNPSGPAINIQNGKRIEMSIKSGSVNTLTDGAGGSWKGALMCKGHLEMKGKGQLNVYGNTAHAIWAKEYYEQKNCTINVFSALKDGLNCNQYFLMESGELNIKGFADDGIQVAIKDSTSTDSEDTGNFVQTGGTINIYMSSATGQGVKYEGSMKRTGGTLNIIEDENDENAVENIFENDMPVIVYSLLGTKINNFTSFNSAIINLQQGIYIFRQGDKSGKIIIK